MKTVNQSLLAMVAALALSLLAACNPDIRLNADEDAPKIAEHVLGMPAEQAAKYLEQHGFVEGIIITNAATNMNPPIRRFSKDPALSGYSEEAAILLTIAPNGTDTVHQVSLRQRVNVQYEKNARELYWKWSHYTAEVTLPDVEMWSGIRSDPDCIDTPPGYVYYVDGTTARHNKQVLEDAYRRGEISKEQYEQQMAPYARNREQFWSDYKSKVPNVSENYRNAGREFPIKEINLNFEAPDGIREINLPIDYYTLYYYTADYVSYVISCE